MEPFGGDGGAGADFGVRGEGGGKDIMGETVETEPIEATVLPAPGVLGLAVPTAPLLYPG